MDFFDLRKETVMPSFASGSAEQILYLLKRSFTNVAPGIWFSILPVV